MRDKKGLRRKCLTKFEIPSGIIWKSSSHLQSEKKLESWMRSLMSKRRRHLHWSSERGEAPCCTWLRYWTSVEKALKLFLFSLLYLRKMKRRQSRKRTLSHLEITKSSLEKREVHLQLAMKRTLKTRVSFSRRWGPGTSTTLLIRLRTLGLTNLIRWWLAMMRKNISRRRSLASLLFYLL